jgi:hypothetical protein
MMISSGVIGLSSALPALQRTRKHNRKAAVTHHTPAPAGHRPGLALARREWHSAGPAGAIGGRNGHLDGRMGGLRRRPDGPSDR